MYEIFELLISFIHMLFHTYFISVTVIKRIKYNVTNN